MTDRQVVSIDGMGGDDGPDMVLGGLERFAQSRPDVHFLLHGDEAVLKAALTKAPSAAPRTEIRHSDKTISMEDKPAQALRRGKGSSMWNAIEAVKKGEAIAAVSAGNTGALMAMAKLILRMMPGVHRPALCASWPTMNGVSAVLDLGADIAADAEQLVEFAIMGEAFARAVHHKPEPTVGLLNIGSEDMKGVDSIKDAAGILKNGGLGLPFVGFVEGNDISMGAADVVVTDGFTGNVALKSAEGAAKLVSEQLKMSLKSSLLGKIGAMIAMPALKRFQAKMDPRQVNGAVFLGLKGVVVKSHGGTDALGFERAIGVAADMGASGFQSEIEASIKRLETITGGANLAESAGRTAAAE